MFDLARLDVCFIAGTLGQGGAERQLFYIVKTLKECGSRVRLLCLTQGEFWENTIHLLGVPITWVGKQQSRALRLIDTIKALRGDPPQVLQSQHFYTNLYAAAAAYSLGIREVGAMRSNGFSEVRANGPLIGRLSLRIPRFIAANSRAAIENANALGINTGRLHLLPNVIDTDQFKPEGPCRKDHIRLVAVGRLGQEKRIDRFLSVLARLRQQSAVEIKGVIVGDGPLRQSLEHRAQALGLLPHVVEFRGAINEMTSIYREADILVLTSDWEGTPNVLLEAMASGLPVVATRVGGVAEVVRQGETGYLVEVDDEETMITSMLKLISDRRLREQMGRAGRDYVVSSRSLRRLPELLRNIYEAALS